MKEKLSRKLRSGIAMLLVCCMIAGFVPAVAFATEVEETKTINYVSIGDSMTNGYGFLGYNQDSDDLDEYNFIEGTGMYGEGAYPLQFEEYLESQGYQVNHTKLAPSAMLTGDLWFLLDGRDEPDDNWTGWRSYVGKTYKRADERVKAHVQSAITDADVITMCVGNAEFGAYLLQRITDALGVLGSSMSENSKMTLQDALDYSGLDAEQQALVQEVYDHLVEELKNYVPDDLWAQYNLTEICNLLAYTTAGYIFNYKGALNAIVEMNPDVEIVLVGLMNTTYGMKVTMDNGEYIPVGDIMDGMFSILNAYMAGLPAVMQLAGQWEDATFYYAQQPNPLFISQQFAALKEAQWGNIDSGRLSGTTVRDRNIKAYNDSLRTMIGQAFGYTSGLPKITLAQVQEFEKNSCVVVNNTPYNDYSISCAVYLAIEDATAASTDTLDIPLSALEKIADLSALAGVFAGVQLDKNSYVTVRESLASYLTSTDELMGMMKIYALFKVGNGMSVHPTPSGHDNIAASVIAAYETGHTAQDQTLENVEALMDELYKLVQTYGPEVAAQVWEQWVEYGYVDAVETSIEELEAMLTARYEYYTGQALPAIEAAVKSLNDQKAALIAQLEALNAELEARKAELEQLIAQQVGTALDTYEAAKAELEAAIAEIEATIENVKSLIRDVETEISEIMDAANDVVDSVKELESVLQDVAESAATLKELIENVYDILTNADPEQAVDAFLEIFDTARNAVLSTAEALELAMGVANELAEDVDALVTKLVDDVTTVYETVSTVLTECYNALPEDVQEILAGAVAAAGEALEAAKAELEEKLAEEIAAVKADAEAKKAELEAACNAKLADIENELNAIAATIKAEAERKCAELEAACNAKLAELEAKKAELEAELEQLNRELSEAAQEAAAEIQAKIDEVNAKLEQVKAEIEDVLDQIEDAYDQAVAEVEAAYAETIEALEKAAADARAELEDAVAEVEQQLTAAVESLKTEAEKQLKELTDAANEAIAGLEEISGELSEDLEAYLNDLSEELAKAEAALEEILSGSKDAVEDLMEALEAIAATGEEELTELVDKIVTTVNTMLYQSTHADLTIDEDFKYVALGDGSAVADGYVELLAEYLNEEATSNGIKNAITYTNYAATGNSVADELKDLNKLAAKVADADLITLGYSNITFLSKALAATEVDWTQYVGEEYAPYIEQLVEELKAELLDSGLTEDTSAYYTGLINALAFSVVQYAVEMPVLVGAIHEINPDAVVVIVGMYNPLSDVSFDTGDGIIELGEYVDYLVEAVAVHGLAYAMISGNAIYVDARDVQTGNTATLLENSHLIQLIATQFAALYPSAAGDQYIANQIADALNLSYETSGLWGDADGNGVVNAKDAKLVLQYSVGEIDDTELDLSVCDVDGNGTVNAKDAKLILQYSTKEISVFPVEQ